MAIKTNAHYREVELPEYRSHPLIAALPPIESDEDIYRRFRTTLPANEVAMLVGYSDPANLYRTFHRETGQTPLQYRAKLKS